ncbi:helix-turn-helix domain-containing protein [Paracoccus sp. MKU1]|uniref:helix-turn-helix domain-containing protein n=1 Tax=Paracoccus sp. MKU1 TaxID=1745182 RepID=UPI00071939CF|nr:helix-turn-helix transcriptional regulator [Paracoccus sp. MKU1]KRW95645.1 DNA-binding protein [Paracoccus sp. MKU1]
MTSIDFHQIGQRLKAYRLGQGLAAEDVAEALAVSRAAVYRIEAGGVVKIETLEKLAGLLETSVASLLGAGVEYYDKVISYFERMRQVEEDADQVIAYFPPTSYLLTSNAYTMPLRHALLEAQSAGVPSPAEIAEVDSIIGILEERKQARAQRGLSVVNFVSAPEVERWLRMGVVGRFGLPASIQAERKLAARREVEHLIALIESEPMGVQIGVIDATLPNVAFQLFRRGGEALVCISPFRLTGDLPNLRSGVAMVTGDVEPVRLYERLAEDLWRRSRRGESAIRTLREVLERSVRQEHSL